MENDPYQTTHNSPAEQPKPAEQTHYSQPPQASGLTEQPPHSSAGLIVLQWLTYALWGWTVFAMSFLTGAVMSSFIEDTGSDTFIAYAVAAVLVLLPLALVSDFYYSKREPAKKTGGASVVLVIHAVIFALFAVGSLVTVVFSIISMALESGNNKSWKTVLYTALIIGILYVAVLLRTLRPLRFPWVKRFFPFFMIAVVGVLTILAFAGPVKKANETKNDRLIEANISQLANNINDYTNQNGQLPTALKDVNTTGDVKKLVDNNLVDYRPNTKSPTKSTASSAANTETVYYYQLCATFKKASNPNFPGPVNAQYDPYVTAYSHEAGNVCFKVATSYSSDSVKF